MHKPYTSNVVTVWNKKKHEWVFFFFQKVIKMIEFLFLRGFIIAFISKKCQSLHNAYDGED